MSVTVPSISVPSIHVPSVRMPSLDAPVSASRDLIGAIAKAADSVGETVVDTVSDNVGALADGVAALLPGHRKNPTRRRAIAVSVAGVIAAVVLVAWLRRRGGDADAVSAHLAEQYDRRADGSLDTSSSPTDDRVDAVSAAD